MGVFTFFQLSGSRLEKILKLLCFLCWGVGGVVYMYLLYETVASTLAFPDGTKLVSASWLLHLGLRFFCLWVPMGFCLIEWKMKKILAMAVYLAGCVAAIFFSFVAFVLVISYTKTDELRNEYIETVKRQMKDADKLPTHVKYMINTNNCCSWFGPTDFAPKSLFDIEKEINTNFGLMQDVAECYGKTFTVKESGNGLTYAPNDANTPVIPTGCSEFLSDTATRVVNAVFFTAILVIILTSSVIAFYIINYMKLPAASQVSPNRPESAAPSDNDLAAPTMSEADR